MTLKTTFATALLLASAAVTAPALAHGTGHDGVTAMNPLAEKVREVNARFSDVNAATAEGYAPIPFRGSRAAPWVSTTSTVR